MAIVEKHITVEGKEGLFLSKESILKELSIREDVADAVFELLATKMDGSWKTFLNEVTDVVLTLQLQSMEDDISKNIRGIS